MQLKHLFSQVLQGAAFILGAGVLMAQSQANTGTIEGTVTDATDRAIANAQVTLTNTGTNLKRVLTTGTDGRFAGLLLPLGTYSVSASAPSFGTLIRDGLDLK